MGVTGSLGSHDTGCPSGSVEDDSASCSSFSVVSCKNGTRDRNASLKVEENSSSSRAG